MGHLLLLYKGTENIFSTGHNPVKMKKICFFPFFCLTFIRISDFLSRKGRFLATTAGENPGKQAACPGKGNPTNNPKQT